MARFRHNRMHRPTRETSFVEYSVRRVKRYMRLTIWIFLWFLVIMGIIWVVPKVWNFVLG